MTVIALKCGVPSADGTVRGSRCAVGDDGHNISGASLPRGLKIYKRGKKKTTTTKSSFGVFCDEIERSGCDVIEYLRWRNASTHSNFVSLILFLADCCFRRWNSSGKEFCEETLTITESTLPSLETVCKFVSVPVVNTMCALTVF